MPLHAAQPREHRQSFTSRKYAHRHAHPLRVSRGSPLTKPDPFSADTPLKGGQAVVLEEGTGFEGHLPKSQQTSTPNVLLSQQRGAAAGSATPLAGSATPLSVRSGSTARSAMPGGATPMRDQLGLNQGADMQQLMVLSERRRQKALRAQLADGLGSLPAPQYSYEVAVPEVEDEDDEAQAPIDEDAADRDARLAARKRAEEEAELERRSTAIKRELPRPPAVNAEAFKVAWCVGRGVCVSERGGLVLCLLLIREGLGTERHGVGVTWGVRAGGQRGGRRDGGGRRADPAGDPRHA
jgi:hypothetical protein